MAFNGSGNDSGPINKRLCTGNSSDATTEGSQHRNQNINNTNDSEPRRKRNEASRPNHILLLTIINPVYPITVDVLHTICAPHGQVQRIVIFKKNGVQAMVEFESIESATRARENLNGADIYSGCCTLKIDYAKPDKLNVYKNDSDSSWDYTMTDHSSRNNGRSPVNKDIGNGRSPLLQDPLYGSRPQPYNQYVDEAAFLVLNTPDYKEMAIPIGLRKKLNEIKNCMSHNETGLLTLLSASKSQVVEPTSITVEEIEDSYEVVGSFSPLAGKYPEDRNLIEVLNRNGGQEVAARLQKNEYVEDLTLFNRILVDDLIKFSTVWPSTHDKSRLAKNIIKQFPQLALQSSDGLPAENLWFHPKGAKDGRKAAGKIEYRLQHIRASTHLRKNSPMTRRSLIFEDIIQEEIKYEFQLMEISSSSIATLHELKPKIFSNLDYYTFISDALYNETRNSEPALLGPGGVYPQYGPPDFHQTTDGWKGAPAHPGLIKDPPLSARNTPNTFVNQGQPQVGAVMMVYGLDGATSNTDKLFNLVCLYGNVARIKFLKTKEGTAMVQMGDSVAVERCVQHLNNIPVGGDCKLQIAFSKQNFLSEVTNPFTLPDHTPSFREYTGSKNNRFLSPAQASKNRIQPPSKILHFFNTPPGLTEEQLLGIFNIKECPPTAVRMFPLKTDRSSSGLVEFPTVAEAVLAIMKCNHIPVESKGTKFPFIMKLCFSSSKNMNAMWQNENSVDMKIDDE